jgi:hypothetical protein
MNLSTVQESNGVDLQNYLQMYVWHRLIVFVYFTTVVVGLLSALSIIKLHLLFTKF